MVAAVGAVGGSSGVNAAKIAAQIMALQRQSGALMKQSKELQKTLAGMPDGDAKKAVQQQLAELTAQIQMIQQQIAQLQQQASGSRPGSVIESIKPPEAAKSTRSGAGHPTVGSRVDTQA